MFLSDWPEQGSILPYLIRNQTANRMELVSAFFMQEGIGGIEILQISQIVSGLVYLHYIVFPSFVHGNLTTVSGDWAVSKLTLLMVQQDVIYINSAGEAVIGGLEWKFVQQNRWFRPKWNQTQCPENDILALGIVIYKVSRFYMHRRVYEQHVHVATSIRLPLMGAGWKKFCQLLIAENCLNDRSISQSAARSPWIFGA